jgi:Cu2+-exporting ATPase
LGLNLSEADDVQYRVGQGVSARVDGRTVRVGTDRFVAAAGVTVPAAALDAASGSRRGARAQLFVSADDEFCGAFVLTGAVRPEAREMIAGLRRRGIRDVRLVSGDDAAATAELAESLGLNRWHASLDAEGKAAHVRRLRAAGHRVCFVGDGTDDADALRAAAVSVSTRGLTAAPPEAAGVLLLGDDLGKLCVLHDASREMNRQLERSWRLALVPGLACTAGAFTLGFGVTTAIVASQVGALLAASGAALSLRDVARARAERRYGMELRRRVAVDGPVG